MSNRMRLASREEIQHMIDIRNEPNSKIWCGTSEECITFIIEMDIPYCKFDAYELRNFEKDRVKVKCQYSNTKTGKKHWVSFIGVSLVGAGDETGRTVSNPFGIKLTPTRIKIKVRVVEDWPKGYDLYEEEEISIHSKKTLSLSKILIKR